MRIMERIKHMISTLSPEARTPAPSAATEVLSVSDFLTEKSIMFFPARLDKSNIFKDLIGSMDLVDPELALKEVLYRELWGRTVIAPGLAIPHARIPGLTRIVAAIGICQKGIADPKSTSQLPSLYLLFVGPTNNVQQHLSFLAAVSTLFQSKDLAKHLVQLTTAGAVFAQLRAAEGAR
jgi:PTS system nitrogen regulatory IIA component